jgi:hypothetical protein
MRTRADTADESTRTRAGHRRRGGATRPVDDGTPRALWRFNEYARTTVFGWHDAKLRRDKPCYRAWRISYHTGQLRRPKTTTSRRQSGRKTWRRSRFTTISPATFR